jgi:hypothetical protein
MYVDPHAEEFTDIRPLEEIESEENKLLVEGKLQNLQKLQDDLRKIGYRQVFNKGPLRP